MHKGWGMGVAVADYDNDGLPDLYVTGYGGNALYHNLGNCKFEDVTDKAGLLWEASASAQRGETMTATACGSVCPKVRACGHQPLPEFGSNEKFCRFRGVMVQCGPRGLPGESDFLFRNRAMAPSKTFPRRQE